MTMATFALLCHDAQQVPPHIRKGQHAFNMLRIRCPWLAEEIRGTPLDPFHNDEVLPEFWNRIYEEVS